MDSGTNQSSALSEHSERLRERTEAICRLSGGEPSFDEGQKVLRDYCDENHFWMDLPTCCEAKPDAFGEEHEVWFVGQRVYKLAYHDFYGLRVIYRPDGDPRCLPHEYFERWHLHNGIFGDQVEIVGAVDFTDGIRLVMVQEAVAGSPAEPWQIQAFFESTGWKRFRTLGETAWYDPVGSLVVSDTHQGNLILTPDGILVPIDFRIQRVDGVLKDAVLSLILP